MSEWKKAKLGEITESCLGKMLDAAKNRGEYKPYLANLNVRWGCFDTDNLSLMKFEEDEDERYGIKYGDLIICEGGEPGRCAIWKEEIPDMKIQKALHRVRPKKGLVDNFYLFYWFLLAGKRNLIDQYCTGATIKHLPGQKLKEVVVDLPPLATQHYIATILSRYDSLIENYQKQIKLLEEAAQRLYKEWFVDLHFPSHENTKIVDGVPEGWAFYRIDNVFKTVLGGTPSRAKSNYWGGNIPWINSGEINKLRIINPSEMITKEGYDNSATKLMPIHTTILAITGATLGQVSYTEIETCANQSVVGIIDESKQMNEYLYLNISNNILSIVNKATGGAQQHINKDIVNAYPFLLPSKDVLDRFKKLVAPMFRQIKNNLIQIESLIEARDRLLPKLMSGEIEV